MADFSTITTIDALREEIGRLGGEKGNFLDRLGNTGDTHLKKLASSPIMQGANAAEAIRVISDHVSFAEAINQFKNSHLLQVMGAYTEKVNLSEELAKLDESNPMTESGGNYTILGSILRAQHNNIPGIIDFINSCKGLEIDFTNFFQEGAQNPLLFIQTVEIGTETLRREVTIFSHIIIANHVNKAIYDLLHLLHEVGVNLNELLSEPLSRFSKVARHIMINAPEDIKAPLIDLLIAAKVDFAELDILGALPIFASRWADNLDSRSAAKEKVHSALRCSSFNENTAEKICIDLGLREAFQEVGKLDRMPEVLAKPDTDNKMLVPGNTILGSILDGWIGNIPELIKFINFAHANNVGFSNVFGEVSLYYDGSSSYMDGPSFRKQGYKAMPSIFSNIVAKKVRYDEMTQLIMTMHKVGVDLQKLLSQKFHKDCTSNLAHEIFCYVPNGTEERVKLIEAMSNAGVDFTELQVVEDILLNVTPEIIDHPDLNKPDARVIKAFARSSSFNTYSAKIICRDWDILQAFADEGNLGEMPKVLSQPDENHPMSPFGAAGTILGAILGGMLNNFSGLIKFINFAHANGVDFKNVFSEIFMGENMRYFEESCKTSWPTFFSVIVDTYLNNGNIVDLISCMNNAEVNLQALLSQKSKPQDRCNFAQRIIYSFSQDDSEKKVAFLEILSEAGVDFCSVGILSSAVEAMPEVTLETRAIQAIVKCTEFTKYSAKEICSNMGALSVYDSAGKLNQMAEILALPDESNAGNKLHPGCYTILGSILSAALHYALLEVFVWFAHSKGVKMGTELVRKTPNLISSPVMPFQHLLPNRSLNTLEAQVELLEKLAFIAEVGVDFTLNVRHDHSVSCISLARKNGKELVELKCEASDAAEYKGNEALVLKKLGIVLESPEMVNNISKIPSLAKAILAVFKDYIEMDAVIALLLGKGVVTEADQLIFDDMSNIDQVAKTLLLLGDFGTCVALMDSYHINAASLLDALLDMPLMRADADPLTTEEQEVNYKYLAKRLVKSVEDMESNSEYLKKAVTMNNLFMVELMRERLEGGVLLEEYIASVRHSFDEAHNFKEHETIGEMLNLLFASCNQQSAQPALEYAPLGDSADTA